MGQASYVFANGFEADFKDTACQVDALVFMTELDVLETEASEQGQSIRAMPLKSATTINHFYKWTHDSNL